MVNKKSFKPSREQVPEGRSFSRTSIRFKGGSAMNFSLKTLILASLLLGQKCSLKGEVSREFDVISKPKNVCLSTETKI